MQTRQSHRATQLANRLLYVATLRPLWWLGWPLQEGPPILISGSPRSGSTWLLEALERHFRARRNWEPLDGIEQHLGSTVTNRRFGLRPYIGREETDHPLAAMLLGIVDGDAPRQWRRAWNPGLGPARNLSRIADARRTVVKFTEAQRSLPFVARHRDNKAVVILRNPLSVTASALTFTGKRDFAAEPPAGPVPEVRRLPANLLRDFPVLEKYADRPMTRAEYIGLSTCIDMLVPLSDPECRRKYCFVAYSTLKGDLTRFDDVVRYLGDERGLTPNHKAYLQRPSHRARAVSALTHKDAAWKDRLSPAEIDQIIAIMADLGIDWFGAEQGLDAGRLAGHGLHNLIA